MDTGIKNNRLFTPDYLSRMLLIQSVIYGMQVEFKFAILLRYLKRYSSGTVTAVNKFFQENLPLFGNFRVEYENDFHILNPSRP